MWIFEQLDGNAVFNISVWLMTEWLSARSPEISPTSPRSSATACSGSVRWTGTPRRNSSGRPRRNQRRGRTRFCWEDFTWVWTFSLVDLLFKLIILWAICINLLIFIMITLDVLGSWFTPLNFPVTFTINSLIFTCKWFHVIILQTNLIKHSWAKHNISSTQPRWRRSRTKPSTGNAWAPSFR